MENKDKNVLAPFYEKKLAEFCCCVAGGTSMNPEAERVAAKSPEFCGV